MPELPAEYKSLFRIVERAELDKIGADSHASFALAPIKGVYMQDTDLGAVVAPKKGGAHGYFPDIAEIQTGFIVVGPSIEKGLEIEGMGLEDVAPTAAALLASN